MTICLALVCESGKSVVAVADRMVSVESLSLEFEQETRKIERLGGSFAVLTAGDALGHTELIREVSDEIAQLAQPDVRQVTAAVEGKFIAHRQAAAEKLVLRRAGMDYETYLERQRDLAPEFVSLISSEFYSFDLEIDALVVGVDASGAHLYHIGDPGISACFDSIGYAAIGSGLPHAEGFLTEAAYSPLISLNRAIWLAYVAKRRSERAPGVGSRFTDVMIIEQEKGARFLSGDSIGKLDAAYEAYLSQLADANQTAEKAIEETTLQFE